jgi:hypothetical protein
MARSTIIEFQSWRDPKGYRLIKAKPPELQRIGRTGRKEDPLEPCRPLDRAAELFRTFVKSATTPEGVLNFVQSYGPLMHLGYDPNGDIVHEVITHASRMNSLLERHWREPSAIRRSWAELPPGVHVDKIQDRDMWPALLLATVIWDPETGVPQWQFRPTSLLNALWFQLGEFLMRGAKLMKCEHCGRLFTAGKGTGRRVVAKFCSDEHRIAFNSLARSGKSKRHPHTGGSKK